VPDPASPALAAQPAPEPLHVRAVRRSPLERSPLELAVERRHPSWNRPAAPELLWLEAIPLERTQPERLHPAQPALSKPVARAPGQSPLAAGMQ